MRTIAVLNLKGGVAKTTTVINMAAVLARDYHQRVLVIDADSQCNTTEFFGGDPAKGNLAEHLRAKYPAVYDPAQCVLDAIQPSNFKGVEILCGDDTLMDLDLSKVESQDVNVGILRQLRELIEELDDGAPPEEVTGTWCLIDCPPAFNAASAAALLMADEVIIPVKLDAFSLRGMANLLRQIANMRKINPSLRLLGCLPTMWEGDELDRQAVEQLKAAGLPVLPHIRYTRKAKKMTYAQEPLLVCSPRSAAGIDYRALVGYLMEGGENNG